MSHYNKLFWLIFAVAGAMFILSVGLGVIALAYLDIVLGLILIAAGIHRIGEEVFNRSMKKAHDESLRTINELLQWAEKSYDYTREFKDKHEKRLYRLDMKRASHEEKTEEMFRDAVKKIIQMENKLNKAIRSLDLPVQPKPAPVQVTVSSDQPVSVEKPKPEKPAKPPAPKVKDLNPVQSRAVAYLRKQGSITNKEYRERFRVTEKKAYSDLLAMYNMGLLKRRGRGRSTHYVLAF